MAGGSEATVQLLANLRDEGEQSLRGRSEPVRIWTWRNRS
jgi:class 3 adenylate cyclase